MLGGSAVLRPPLMTRARCVLRGSGCGSEEEVISRRSAPGGLELGLGLPTGLGTALGPCESGSHALRGLGIERCCRPDVRPAKERGLRP